MESLKGNGNSLAQKLYRSERTPLVSLVSTARTPSRASMARA